MNTVEELLTKKGLKYTASGRDYLIKCLNPHHEDTNPSLRVDKTSGVCHCLSCGFKANLFRYFGILTTSNNIRVAKLKEKLEGIKADLYGVPPPKGFTPYTRSYRDISVSTLMYFGAGVTSQVTELEDRLMFPIPDITGKVLVYVARHMLSQENPRYLNYPSGSQMPLYPAKLLDPSLSSLVLVEGIFDMLNLYDKGLTNVACCFGTNTIKNTIKDKLLPYVAQGVTKIYIMFDGDAPGQLAAEELKPVIENMNLSVEILPMDDDMDPGDASTEDVQRLIAYINT